MDETTATNRCAACGLGPQSAHPGHAYRTFADWARLWAPAAK